MAKNVHIEHICGTEADVRTNIDALQLGILSDQNEEMVYSNLTGSKIYYIANQKYWNGAALTYCNVDFGQVTVHSDLLVSEYIKRSGGTDDFIRFENDKITAQVGGATAVTFEPTVTTFIQDIHLLGTTSPKFTIECSDATDPLLIFKTTNTAHEIQISLDENVTPDDLQIFGQTAGVDMWVSIQAVAGQDAILYLKTAGVGSARISHTSADNFLIQNDIQDKDIIFAVDDGGVAKTITWDADVDQLKHSAGTFNFHDDNLTTTGSITGNSFITASDIGIAADTDLMQLASNVLVVNGVIRADPGTVGAPSYSFIGDTHGG
ncbi:MAG: hypothetical protein ABII90_15630, partial [Bacteroidota bacterium]